MPEHYFEELLIQVMDPLTACPFPLFAIITGEPNGIVGPKTFTALEIIGICFRQTNWELRNGLFH